MGTILLNILLKVLSSEMTKTLIGIGINKLLAHKTDGITKDLSKVLIEGVVKSKSNPVSADILTDAIKLLDK